MRVVLDTNIIVSALIRPGGDLEPVLRSLRDGEYTILYAQRSLDELMDVLARPRIRDKYGLTTDDDVESILALILLRGEAVVASKEIVACRDPKDDLFLNVAVSGQADAIVSGDEDLLVLHPFEGIPILSPAEFLTRLREVRGRVTSGTRTSTVTMRNGKELGEAVPTGQMMAEMMAGIEQNDPTAAGRSHISLIGQSGGADGYA